MSGLSAGHVGIAGEVRCIVKREDGSIKEDTGFQKNIILNQGLDFFGGGKGDNIFAGCAIGSGNTTPSYTQTQLSSFLAITAGVQSGSKYDYVPDGSNLYKTNKVYKYTFTGLNNVNVSEVGLSSQGNTISNYYLCTRALIKDNTGLPTTITILSGEILEVYYKLWRVVSTLDVDIVVNMLDGKGGSAPYNIIVRPCNVGDSGWANKVGEVLSNAGNTWFTSGNISNIQSYPNTGVAFDISASQYQLSTYTAFSYKRVIIASLGVTQGNSSIRSMYRYPQNENLFPFQIRFGSVVGDNPIPKTNLQTLSIPLEFSWGRYEGVL